ncbi:MAG: hypothetical protein WCC60_13320 [Ilumatobacteraceae bacterium]
MSVESLTIGIGSADLPSDLVVWVLYARLEEPADRSVVNHSRAVQTLSTLQNVTGPHESLGGPLLNLPSRGYWGPDPYIRYQQRWNDGTRWSNQVANGDQVAVDEPGWR